MLCRHFMICDMLLVMSQLEKKGLLSRPANIARLMMHELEGSH